MINLLVVRLSDTEKPIVYIRRFHMSPSAQAVEMQTWFKDVFISLVCLTTSNLTETFIS